MRCSQEKKEGKKGGKRGINESREIIKGLWQDMIPS